jgi:hypothetical protein
MTKIKKILQILLPLVLAGFLFWWVYRDMDFSRLAEVFKSGLHYEWLILSVVLSTLSNIVRGLRWHALIEPVCPGGTKKTAILGVFVSYAVNLIFPRAGEVARCGILRKSEGLSFTKTLGTVITERMFDGLCLILIAIVTILLQLGFFRDFFVKNPSSLEKMVSIITSPYIWGSLLAIVVLFFIAKKQIKNTRFYEKIYGILIKLWEGMKSIVTLKRPFIFILYTLLIWLIYFIMFYIAKYFFPFDIPLGLLPMLSGFVMGTLGILAPVQGGIGAYHFMVIYTLMFYGISEPDAGVFALIIHGLQTIVSLLSGLIAWLLIVVSDRRIQKQEDNTN